MAIVLAVDQRSQTAEPTRPKPLRILVLAFDCHPTLPSLPVVAFKVCKELARRCEVTVVSRKQDDHSSVPGAETVFLNLNWIKNPFDGVANLLHGGRPVGWTTKTAFAYPTYLAFEHAVWRRYRNALQQKQFDVVLRVSPMSPVLPSPMAKWCPVPFVLGPVNGRLAFPQEVKGAGAREREWLNPVRRLSRCLPYAKSSYRSADAILVGFQHTIDSLPADARHKMIHFPEIGYDPELFFPLARPAPMDHVRFVFAGRLVPNKCAESLVEAFARNPALQKHELILVGGGPSRATIQDQIGRHRLESCVTLAGTKDQREVGKILRSSHVFAFPSIRELGAGVVIEAMASGLPCVVVDSGAPGSLVDGSRGLKVPLCSREAMADQLAEVMGALADDPQRILKMRAGALQYASGYDWPSKVDSLVEVFHWVTGKRPTKPEPYGL